MTTTTIPISLFMSWPPLQLSEVKVQRTHRQHSPRSTALRTCLIEAMGDEAPIGVIMFAGALILLSAALPILILMMP